MNKFTKNSKNQEGITLVALVITVVVMLILAGVAIAAVVDGDGLFSKTRQAAETYENAARNEADQIKTLMNEIDNYLKDTPKDENPIVKPTAILGTVVTENQTYDGRLKGEYNNPIIPKGFAPVENAQDSTITIGADWGSAEGYKYGLVIEDVSGNQFVWVPVDGTNVKFGRYDFGKGTSMANCEESIPEGISGSIEDNEGFYIARFEAGIATNMPQEGLSSDSSATYGNGNYKPVSKQGAIVWNYIQWGDQNNDTNPENGAVTVARSMYPEGDTNYGAVSTLIYGAQWDTALRFIGAYGGDTDYATDSTGKGNYYGTVGGDPSSKKPDACGAYDVYRQKNIYDMAGNVFEWTMEKYGSTSGVSRGGHFNYSGSYYPASYRGSNYVYYANSYDGFRVGLYIKSSPES